MLLFVTSAKNNEGDDEEQTGGGGLGDKVSLYKGDITVLEVDAIVNAGRNFTLTCSGCCLDGERAASKLCFAALSWRTSGATISSGFTVWMDCD